MRNSFVIEDCERIVLYRVSVYLDSFCRGRNQTTAAY
jgi:hypothetical protein